MEFNNEVSYNILYIVFIFLTVSIIFLYMKGEEIKIIVDRKKKKNSKKRSRCKKKMGSRNQKKRSSMCMKKRSSRRYKKRSSRRSKKRSSRRYKKRSSRRYKKRSSRHCKKKRSPKHLKKHLKSVNQIFPTEINSNHLINQHVVPYTIKDINQEFNVGNDLFVIVNNFHVPLRFLNVDYDKENYNDSRIYQFGDVVTIKDPKSGELQDYVNLVSDVFGIVGQNPLKDKIAWLKIRINRLNGKSNSQLL